MFGEKLVDWLKLLLSPDMKVTHQKKKRVGRSERGLRKERGRKKFVARAKLYQAELEKYRQQPGVNRFAKKLPAATVAALQAEYARRGILPN